MKATTLLVFLALALGLSGCGGSGGDRGGSSISGMVIDLNYEPISGAVITAGSRTGSSLSDGSYNLSGLSNGTYIISISAPGYTTSYRKVVVSGSSVSVPIAFLSGLDSKVTQVGGAGGVVSNTDGGMKLDIPSGALSSATEISLTEVPLLAAPTPPPVGSQFIAVIVYLTPNDLSLNGTAELTIPNVTGLPSGTVVPFFHLDTTTLNWDEITGAGGIASLEAGTITAGIGLFGWTAAIVQVAPSVGYVSGVVRDASTLNGIANAPVWSSYFGTVADVYGAYTLDNLPTGEATVEAIAPGYNRGNKHVTITVGGSSPPSPNDILLVKKNVGAVSGKIRVKGTSDGIPGARVVGGGMETTSNSNGNYTLLNMPTGPVTIYAYANGFISSFESGVVFPDQTTNIDVELTSSGTSPAIWSDGFESGTSKWTLYAMTNEVQWTNKPNSPIITNVLHPHHVTLEGLARVADSHGGNYCMWFGNGSSGFVSRGSYCGVLATTEALDGGTSSAFIKGSLTSEAIDLRDVAYATLSFWTNWEIESKRPTAYDYMIIAIATEPYTTYQAIGLLNPIEDPDQTQRAPHLPYSSGGFREEPVWVKHSFDLTPFVGNRIKLSFVFDTGGDFPLPDLNNNGFRGWLIDDVSIAPQQISSSSISSASIDRRPDSEKVRQILLQRYNFQTN